MNKKYKYSRKYLDVKQMPFYLAIHWKSILIVALAFGIIMAGINGLNQVKAVKEYNNKYPDGVKTKSVSVSGTDKVYVQQYIDNKKALAAQQEYNKSSLLMKINPDNVKRRIIRYFATRSDSGYCNDKTIAISYEVQQEEILEEIASKLGLDEEDSIYVKELITVDASVGQTVIITINGSDEEQIKVIGDTLIEVIEERFIPEKVAELPELSIKKIADIQMTVRDTVIRDNQNNNISKSNTYAGLIDKETEEMSEKTLSYANKCWDKIKDGVEINVGDKISYTQKVERPKYAIMDCFLSLIKNLGLGIVLMIAFWALVFVATPYIWSGKNILDSFEIDYLGWIDSGKKKTKIWKLHNKRNDKTGVNQVLCILNNVVEKDAKLIVLTDYADTEAIKNALAYSNMDIVSTEMLLNKSASIATNNGKYSLLFMADISKTKYSDFARMLKITELHHDKVLGCVTIE